MSTSRLSSKIGLERAPEVARRPRADQGLLRLAAGEEDHRRDREHVVARRRRRVVVDVQLDELDLLRFAGDLLEHGVHGMARSAPRRPEVDDDGLPRLEHVLLEARVCDLAHGDPAYRRPVSARSLTSGTFHTASSTIERLIFEWPCSRSTNAIGTSTMRNPARRTRYVVSIWNA